MRKPDNLTDALGLTYLSGCPVTFLYQYQILEEFDSPMPRAGSTWGAHKIFVAKKSKKSHFNCLILCVCMVWLVGIYCPFLNTILAHHCTIHYCSRGTFKQYNVNKATKTKATNLILAPVWSMMDLWTVLVCVLWFYLMCICNTRENWIQKCCAPKTSLRIYQVNK